MKFKRNVNYRRFEQPGLILFPWLVSWSVVLGLAAVIQSISGRLTERGRKRSERTEDKKCPTNPHPHLLQAQ